LRPVIQAFKSKGKSIGFVPTMGYLHAGHLSLFQKSKRENDITIVSIFVNPLQFGPREDFRKYPRDKKKDEMLAKKEKVDIIFHPSEKEMYSLDFLTYVTTRQLSNGLCGLFRPGHFRGVTTVVSKLLNIVAPDVLYLGQKDLQQAVILKKMMADLNFPAKVRICPTIRERNGLALSSRNTYLSREQSQEAIVLYQALQKAKKMIQQGERKANIIIQTVKAMIQLSPQASKIDYVACVGVDTLETLTTLKGKVAIALAVWFGKTRLIDNTIVTIK